MTIFRRVTFVTFSSSLLPIQSYPQVKYLYFKQLQNQLHVV